MSVPEHRAGRLLALQRLAATAEMDQLNCDDDALTGGMANLNAFYVRQALTSLVRELNNRAEKIDQSGFERFKERGE